MNIYSNIAGAYPFFDQAPVVIGFVRGANYVIEFANEALQNVWKVDNSVYGKSLFDVFPALESQGFRQLLDNVRTTGNPFKAYEFPIAFERDGITDTYYFDFIYQPFREGDAVTGVIAVGHDVTEKVLAKKQVERGDTKWKQLANSLPVIVWTADENGNVDFFNRLWYETTGQQPEDTKGFGWTKALHPDDVERCLQAWNQALANRTFYEMEVRYQRRDGSYQWALARGVPIFENNKVVSWYGTSTDISEQKNIERKLEDAVKGQTQEIEHKDSLLQSILKNSSNGISVSRMIFDGQGNVVDALTILANDAAVKFSGLPREQYLSKPASHFDPNIISSAYGQACINTLKTGQPFIMRYFLEFSKRWLELTVSKMDESHLIHHFTDVTPIREAELKLEKTLEDLRYSNANLEEFAYAASHDLKEPIRKSQYYANRLKEDLKETLTDQQRLLFQRLENSQARMDKLIVDLLEYSQAAKGAADVQMLDLNSEVKHVLEDLELEIQKKGAKILVGELPSIKGNKRQIHQLFQNLISNSLKYNRDSVAPEISIVSQVVRAGDVKHEFSADVASKDYNLITISDNGIGFEQIYADKIFKVFTRLHANEQYRGSGIGLSIVKKVVESHHGVVWAESEPLKGTVFKILLPVDTAN
ncbi:MAG TPA: PAS domain S-box protein [Chryseosolibacter sp.]